MIVAISNAFNTPPTIALGSHYFSGLPEQTNSVFLNKESI